MGSFNKRFNFHLVFIFLAFFSTHLFAKDFSVLPEAVCADARNASKGGGAIVSSNSAFFLNPSLDFFAKRYQITTGYTYKSSAVFSIFDSRTTKYGGGILYSKNGDLNAIKTNFAIPFGNVFFFGMNYNHYFGKKFDVSDDTFHSQTIDVGISAFFGKFLMFGLGAKDLFTFSGPNMHIKGTAQMEINLFKNFFANCAFVYHFQHKKELITKRREKLKNIDFMTGLEFRYSFFVLSGGFSNSSFEEKMSFDTTLKTFGVGIYKEGFAGLFAGYYFKKDYSAFSINLIWEPQIK